MKLKDTDFLYATMRVRVNEKNLLTEREISRMIDAKTPEEAAKILSESGYGEVSARSFSDIEKALQRQRRLTADLIDEVCEDKQISEVFLLKYDFHNIKTLIKAELAGEAPERLMSDLSCIPKEKLIHAAHTDDMTELPLKMAEAMKQARETLAHTGDPQRADFILDRAYFEMLCDAAESFRSEFLKGYVSLLADTANLRAAVRAARQGRGAEVLAESLVPGGSIEHKRFLTYDFENSFSNTPLSEAAVFGAAAAKGNTGLLEFERELDNIIIRYMHGAKYVSFDERPIIAYIAAKEAEAMTVRIIMAGKLENLPPDEIRNRLRVL
ncbi:MAG: V-type ATPase subunit [Oscillospiraceae bacterium]|nr:V-type ATPase subunit [Oscillospiraceae bacterium]